MALNEALQGLEEKAEGVSLSDDEDGQGFERDGVDHEVLIQEFALILESYTTGKLFFSIIRTTKLISQLCQDCRTPSPRLRS
jgi:hypothetical protein